jgi:hypothetical protein
MNTSTVDLEELRILCEIAMPSLRKFARNCPDCEGSGEVILHDDTSEECATCMALNDLIDYLTPKPPKPEPRPVTVTEVEDDDLPF